MASKKKRGGKPRATTRAKVKAKAKAGARKAKRPPARKRAPVTVAKARSRKAAVTKKRMPRAAAAAPAKPSTERSGPLILDEVLEESLLDVSTILRVKDGVARSQRDIDEDERRQFSDPSLVVEVQTRNPRREEDDTDESVSHLPDLFAAEARAQKARAADRPAQKRPDGSLFGALGSRTPEEDVDPEED
ncbi:MAG: hypothetical protein ACXVDD_14570 [Polyangia bacterium]